MTAEVPFSHSVRVRDLPPAGRKLHLKAGADELAEIARSMGILAVERLEADVDLQPASGNSLRVRGVVDGDVVQTCIVTLDPVQQTVRESFDIVFLPEEEKGAAGEKTVLLDPMEEEERDYYSAGRLELGPIVREHLALGLDPYPRKPETDFQPHIEGDTSDRVSPFESLKQLKDRKS
jgi:uncharacterized protein